MYYDINTLLAEKDAVLISLGKMLHKLIRDGSVNDDSCRVLSDRIAQIDEEIARLSGKSLPVQGSGICPICKMALPAPMSKFCGACGANVVEFYEKFTATCEKCGQVTSSEAAYCGICGEKRSG